MLCLCVKVLLFTATMPAEVEETAQQWQSNPVIVQVSTSGASISRTVVQVSKSSSSTQPLQSKSQS